MGNDMVFTTYNELIIILYIKTLSKFFLKFSPSLIGFFTQNKLFKMFYNFLSESFAY